MVLCTLLCDLFPYLPILPVVPICESLLSACLSSILSKILAQSQLISVSSACLSCSGPAVSFGCLYSFRVYVSSPSWIAVYSLANYNVSCLATYPSGLAMQSILAVYPSSILAVYPKVCHSSLSQQYIPNNLFYIRTVCVCLSYSSLSWVPVYPDSLLLCSCL
jgi:hypothetical protein